MIIMIIMINYDQDDNDEEDVYLTSSQTITTTDITPVTRPNIWES